MKINVMQYVDIYHKGNIQFPYKITKKLIDDLVII